MTIKVGTVCLLLAPHSKAGHCCTVVEPPALTRRLWVGNAVRATNVIVYGIALSNGPWYGPNGYPYGAQPAELLPISDPDFRESEPTRETVRE